MAATHRLLSTKERHICEQIATHAGLYGQRARALLALDDGGTRAEAGTIASLSPGQVKYVLTKFRQQRLEIFPAEILDKLQPKTKNKASPLQKIEPTEVQHPQTVVVEDSASIPDVAREVEQPSVDGLPEKERSIKKKKKKKKAQEAKSKKSTKKDMKAKKGQKTKDKPSKKKKKKKKKAKALKV
jgi:hypothetical protein